MNLMELEIELKKLEIPVNSYSLKGGLPNEAFCISSDNNQWEIYYSERGNKTLLKSFQSEQEACDYFILWVKEI